MISWTARTALPSLDFCIKRFSFRLLALLLALSSCSWSFRASRRSASSALDSARFFFSRRRCIFRTCPGSAAWLSTNRSVASLGLQAVEDDNLPPRFLFLTLGEFSASSREIITGPPPDGPANLAGGFRSSSSPSLPSRTITSSPPQWAPDGVRAGLFRRRALLCSALLCMLIGLEGEGTDGLGGQAALLLLCDAMVFRGKSTGQPGPFLKVLCPPGDGLLVADSCTIFYLWSQDPMKMCVGYDTTREAEAIRIYCLIFRVMRPKLKHLEGAKYITR
mmetsp:Transcript_20296/g.46553  ORF Transcript_20296/g.46553 Transcript_20296/m.46553 type:complete len:277 (-) Transcript_20296:140-970(-)